MMTLFSKASRTLLSLRKVRGVLFWLSNTAPSSIWYVARSASISGMSRLSRRESRSGVFAADSLGNVRWGLLLCTSVLLVLDLDWCFCVRVFWVWVLFDGVLSLLVKQQICVLIR